MQTQRKYPQLGLVAPAMFAAVFFITLIYSHLEPYVEDVDMYYVKTFAGRPGYVLVDTRPEEQYMGKSPKPGVPGGHIPGAISFPLENLTVTATAAALATAGITKNNTIIVYCNSGGLSGRFADQLVRRFNFSASKVKNYKGSIEDWTQYPGNLLLPQDHERGIEDPILTAGDEI